MATPMSRQQWRDFLSAGTRTGKLATVGADGAPHVVPVWFVLDGEELVLTTGADTVKARNLARDPRAALTVDDERPPFSFVLVRGSTRIGDDPQQLLHWATRIGARYMGEERGAEFGARNAVPGEVLVRLRIERVTAIADLSD